jgi:hypothetical protein
VGRARRRQLVSAPPNKPLKLSAAGFSRASGLGRHESW